MRWEIHLNSWSFTAQHLPSTGFLSLDLSHLCLHSHISRICHGSYLPAIKWKKHRKRATCISSSFFLLQPSRAFDEQTNFHAEDDQPNLHPRESTAKLPRASADFALQHHKPANPTLTGGGEELRHSPMAPQKLQSNKGPLSTAAGKVTVNTVSPLRTAGDFRLVQDSWPSGRPGEADLLSLLPKCFMLESPGSPWQCKSRLVAAVLPVSPTASSSMNLIALDIYNSVYT